MACSKGHKAIRQLIENTAKSLADNIQFAYEAPGGFDQIREQRYPYVVLDPPVAVPTYSVNNVSNYSKTWLIQMAFWQPDQAAATGDESAKILDDMDLFVDKFLNKLNFYTDMSADILIQSMRQEPFIKVGPNVLTGYILNFQIVVNDDFEYCEIAC